MNHKKKIYLKFLGFALGLFLLIPAPSPIAAGEHDHSTKGYIARIWNTDAGLPHNNVCALVQTRDRYLWLGTPAGLVRFDGIRCEVFDHLNTPLLTNSRVLSLYEDADAVLWIGTDGGGLYALKDNEWRRYGERDGLVNGHVRAVTGDIHGNLWVGTEYGLHRLNGEGVRVYGLEEGLSDNLITALAADQSGRLWAGTMRGGLARFEDGLVQIYDVDDGLAGLTVLSLEVGPDSVLWIGTMDGLFNLRPDEGVVRPVPRTYRYPVTSLAPTPRGEMLIGTMVEGLKFLGRASIEGIATGDASGQDLLTGGAYSRGLLPVDSYPKDLLLDEELSNSHICVLLLDRNGHVWIGTKSRGLVQVKERRVGAITGWGGPPIESGKEESPFVLVSEGSPLGSVYPLLEDNDGTLLIGTENDGLYRMRGGRITKVLDRSQGLAGNMVRTLLRDRSGKLWVGTMDGGVSILANGRIRNLTGTSGLASDNVTAIVQDGAGTVWVGTDRGLNRYINGKVTAGEPISMFDGQVIRTLVENDRGVLYAATRSGVWKLSGDSFERIVAENDTTGFDVLSLYEDGDGSLWMGTNGSGLKRLSKSRITTCTTEDGLPGNFIFSILEEDAGLLWISCEGGVFSISRDSLSAYTRGEVHILTPTLFDDNDGMPSARCNGFCCPAVCESRLGKRLYPTKGGIAVFDRRYEREQRHPEPGDLEPTYPQPSQLQPPHPRAAQPSQHPVPHIESILADEIPVRDEEAIELPGKTDRIEIRFTAFDYSAPEKCRFLYRLEGYDPGFTALHPSQDRTAVYRDLPPGEYTFSLRAIGNGGLWSERTATARLVIIPPFHRTKAFLLIVIAGIVLAGGAVAITTRYRRIQKQRMKYSTTTIDTERMERALSELKTLMEEEKVFLDPDLTLQKLAQRLKIHYNQLSRIINERFEMSFNNYMNRYRIEEAQRRLADPAERNRNILEIMYDVGFYSKSTFNTAFKKFTGMSPSEYRRKHG
ncbi:MAG: helix-turn-helix domain-containing protein [bacterium]|nr:MAG: helix-turn-helix domain-containing protein [bacterium]